ncbi:MAG: hypothetical protein IKS31_08125 [Clostridia bacterium]|nr:hypothetical protein [Clostridia bacterium]
MSNYEGTVKQGHPVLGIVLGILGILTAILLSLLFGVITGAIAAVLGIIAVLLGIGARKSGRGVGAIVIGAIAILLAVSMTFVSVRTMNELHDKALENERAPLFAECFENPYTGLFGIFVKANGMGSEKVEELRKEIELITAQNKAADKTVEAVKTTSTAEAK